MYCCDSENECEKFKLKSTKLFPFLISASWSNNWFTCLILNFLLLPDDDDDEKNRFCITSRTALLKSPLAVRARAGSLKCSSFFRSSASLDKPRASLQAAAKRWYIHYFFLLLIVVLCRSLLYCLCCFYLRYSQIRAISRKSR